jgi:ATP-dependent RNA helicase DeaD
VHRIGRTGRAGREGTAITLVEPREHRLLKALEKVVKQRIEPARIPSAADIKARRISALTAALRATLVEDAFDGYRIAVQALAQEYDALDIAAAAAKLAAEATHGDEPEEWVAPARMKPVQRPRSDKQPADGSRPPRRRADAPVRLLIDLGDQRGIRPKDIVGAITNEAGIPGHSIGSIEIGEKRTLVEVPESVADKVIRALARTTIKGQRVTARRAD